MKTLTFVLGLFFVLTANAQFGISRAGTSDLVCNVYRSIGRLENGLLIYPCVSSNKETLGIGFLNIPMTLPKAAAAGSKLNLYFHCTVKSPKGVFPFGGETVGFETSAEKHEKFFYAAGEGNYGRCFFRSDSALIRNFPLKVNKSAIVLVPAGLKGPEVAR